MKNLRFIEAFGLEKEHVFSLRQLRCWRDERRRESTFRNQALYVDVEKPLPKVPRQELEKHPLDLIGRQLGRMVRPPPPKAIGNEEASNRRQGKVFKNLVIIPGY